MTDLIPIEVEVYRYADPTVMVDVLNARIAPSALDEIKGPGGGNISISVHDPKVSIDPTLIAYRNVLKFRDGDHYVGAMVIQKKTTAYIDKDPSKEVYLISGEGLRTWFNDAAVYPEGGLSKTSFQDRNFNFSSLQGDWYNPAQWVAPTNVQKWGDVAASPWRYAPANWPDFPNAYWIWSSDSTAGAPVGDNFFRYEFDVATAAKYALFLAADDQFTVYIDGQLQVQSDPSASAYSNTEQIDADLPVGHHVIAIRVTNTGGPAALIAALAVYGDPTQPSSSTTVTYTGKSGDTNWKVAAYPDPVPGWSAGEILLTLLEEAETRGVRFPTYLNPTFTGTTDSYGNTWDRSLDWTFGVGDNYTSVINKMEELVCDIWIDPDTYTLNAAIARGHDYSDYTYDVDGVTVTKPPVIFEKGHNLQQASLDGVSEIVNSLLITAADGWIEVDDADDDEASSTNQYGRIEALLDTSASDAVSQAVAAAVFQQKANPEEGATYTIVPTEGAVPYVDFNVGDWVMAPNEVGLLVKRRVMSITTTEDDSGNPVYSVEFDTIFQDNDDKLNTWLTKLGGGALGGQFANSGGGSASPIGQPTIPPIGPAPIKIPVAPDGLTATSIGLWSADGVNAFSEVTLSWNPVTENTDGTPTVPQFYEVWGHLTANSDHTYQRYAVTTETTAAIRPFDTGSEWTFHVRALNAANALGAYSDPITHVMAAPTTPMPAPTAPTLSSSKGVLIINWDGNLVGTPDAAPPPQFRYVYAVVATSSGGTYTAMGTTLSKAGNIYVSGLNVGDTYYVELIAVDGNRISSAPSDEASETVSGIDLGDLDPSIEEAIDAANQAALDAHNLSNILLDPSFEANDPTIWSIEDPTNVSNSTSDPRTGLRSMRIVSTASSYLGTKYQHLIPVDEGDSFYLSGWVREESSFDAPENGAGLFIEYGTDSSLGSADEIDATDDSLSTDYSLLAGVWSAPSGTRFMRVSIGTDGDTTPGNVYLFDDITLRRQIPSELIVDGAVSAGKIAAGAVVAEKIAAGAVAADAIQANSITGDKIAAQTITGELIAAGTIEGDNIDAGTITVTNLRGDVGQQLNIEDNTSIQLVVGQISDVTDDLQGTQDNLTTMQTYYSFGVDGAIISSPSSPYSIHIASDRIEILQLGVPVSYWNAGQMYVNSFVGTEVILGNHKIEKYGTGTVVRAL